VAFALKQLNGTALTVHMWKKRGPGGRDAHRWREPGDKGSAKKKRGIKKRANNRSKKYS